MIVFLIVIVIVLAIAAFAIGGFNTLRKADIGAQEALGGIDVQLTRRAELIPNLVNTVKGYAVHEKSVFEEVTAARTSVANAAASGTVPEKAAADAELQKALVNVMAVAENYPDLKASASFQQLQTELSDTENKLAFSRQYYNDSVRRLNESVSTFPTMLFTGIAGVKTREFYAAPEANQAPPTVSF